MKSVVRVKMIPRTPLYGNLGLLVEYQAFVARRLQEPGLVQGTANAFHVETGRKSTELAKSLAGHVITILGLSVLSSRFYCRDAFNYGALQGPPTLASTHDHNHEGMTRCFLVYRKLLLVVRVTVIHITGYT